MKIRRVPYPVPDKDARLRPKDFSSVLKVLPPECTLIGGQAVAWWAERYGLKIRSKAGENDITSRDIDIWGSREDLLRIATALKLKPAFPHEYEMTVLVGGLELSASGKKTALEVLHTVPGLDSANPSMVAVAEQNPYETGGTEIMVLSPVSLVLTKLHALRHFPQDERQDLMHLQVALAASKEFIAEVLIQNTRNALWNCNRLIEAHRQKSPQRLEREHKFNLLDGIPIDAIQAAVRNVKSKHTDRLKKFLEIQWPQVSGKPRMERS